MTSSNATGAVGNAPMMAEPVFNQPRPHTCGELCRAAPRVAGGGARHGAGGRRMVGIETAGYSSVENAVLQAAGGGGGGKGGVSSCRCGQRNQASTAEGCGGQRMAQPPGESQPHSLKPPSVSRAVPNRVRVALCGARCRTHAVGWSMSPALPVQGSSVPNHSGIESAGDGSSGSGSRRHMLRKVRVVEGEMGKGRGIAMPASFGVVHVPRWRVRQEEAGTNPARSGGEGRCAQRMQKGVPVVLGNAFSSK